jgi:cell division protein FtsL
MSKRTFFLGVAIIALLIISLYRAKYGAKDTAEELVTVQTAIELAEHEKAMLETDLSHMSRREWIEEYARKNLGMAPPRPGQIADEANLDRLIGPPVQPGAAPDSPTETGETPEPETRQ